MPLYKDVQTKRPVILNSITGFRLDDRIQIADDVNGQPYWLSPDASGRGAGYIEDVDGSDTTVILRGNGLYLHQSDDQTNARFPAGKQFALTGLGTGYSAATISTIHNISAQNLSGGNFWALGQNTTGGAFIHSKVNRDVLQNTTGWTAYDADSPWPSDSFASFMRRDDSGALYCLVHNGTSPYNYAVLKKAPGDSNFTNVTTSGIANAAFATAYQVSSDGLTHMMAYGNSEARSLDGGVTWSTMSVGIDGVTDIAYSPKYRSWVMAAPTGASNPGCRFSYNNGGSWSDSRVLGASSGDTTTTRFTHIEKVDPNGQYMFAVRNTNPIRTYFSEDGGKTWIFSQCLRVPNYGTAPELGRTVLVNTGNRILLYMGAAIGGYPSWNHDNSMFASGLTGLDLTLV